MNRQTEAELRFENSRQAIHNSMSPAFLQSQLVDTLPAIAEKLPKPDELRTLAIGDNGARDGQALAGLVAQVMSVIELFRGRHGAAGPHDGTNGGPAAQDGPAEG